MPKPIDLSIIVPAYQEAAVIEKSLASLAAWLDTHDYGQVEVLVVSADSPDGTADLARAQAHRFASLRVIPAGKRVGKGRDVRLGMLGAAGRYRVFMDADLATPLVHLDDVWALMQQDADVIIAVRNLWRIHHGIKRKFITKCGNWLARIVLLPGVKDTQCGFKAFRADVAESTFSQLTILNWGFDLEILAMARRFGYQIAKFDAPDWHDPKEAVAGLTGDSAGKAALQVLGDLWHIRLNLWRGRYHRPA